MSKVVVIVELIDDKSLNITGPLEHNRDLCIRMLKEALRVAESCSGATLVLPTPSKFVDLSNNHVNHQLRKSL
jgi:hypothetical protein